MGKSNDLSPAVRVTFAGIAAWILPGAGQIVAGDRNRGLIMMVAIGLTFWGGVAIGGVRSTVDPHRSRLWFMAQICGGGHTIAAYAIGDFSRRGLDDDDLKYAEWNSTEVALVYTGVAGLLNLLAILDALMRADPTWRQKPRHCPWFESGCDVTDLVAQFFVTPVDLTGFQKALLILPLCLSISVVYKATRLQSLRRIVPAVLHLWVTIVIGMYTVGIGLWLCYRLLV